MKQYKPFAISAILLLGIAACSDENSTPSASSDSVANIIKPSWQDAVKELSQITDELSKFIAEHSESQQLREHAGFINEKLKRISFLESVIRENIDILLMKGNEEEMGTYLAAQLMLAGAIGARDFTPENRQLVITLSQNNVYLNLMAQCYAMAKVFDIAGRMDMNNLDKHEEELAPWLEELVQLQATPCLNSDSYGLHQHPLAEKIMNLWIEGSMNFAQFLAVIRIGTPTLYGSFDDVNPQLDKAPRIKKAILELTDFGRLNPEN